MELHVIEREGRETVVLLDNEMRIVKPVYDYLKFQRQKDKALNTLKATNQKKSAYRNDYETVFSCFYRNDCTLSYFAGRRG